MNKPDESYIPQEVKFLAELMKGSGYRLFIVGGFVRDMLLGADDYSNADIDICGDCKPDEFRRIIESSSEIYLCEANYPLGTLKIVIGGISVEYTTFRKESYRGDGFHTPSTVIFTDDLYQDALRRDFTINAIYLDPISFEIVDPFNGQQDIFNKIIKNVIANNTNTCNWLGLIHNYDSLECYNNTIVNNSYSAGILDHGWDKGSYLNFQNNIIYNNLKNEIDTWDLT